MSVVEGLVMLVECGAFWLFGRAVRSGAVAGEV